MSDHLRFGLRVGIALAMTHLHVVIFINSVLDFIDARSLMTSREQSFYLLALMLLGYLGIRWLEYVGREFWRAFQRAAPA